MTLQNVSAAVFAISPDNNFLFALAFAYSPVSQTLPVGPSTVERAEP